MVYPLSQSNFTISPALKGGCPLDPVLAVCVKPLLTSNLISEQPAEKLALELKIRTLFTTCNEIQWFW